MDTYETQHGDYKTMKDMKYCINTQFHRACDCGRTSQKLILFATSATSATNFYYWYGRQTATT